MCSCEGAVGFVCCGRDVDLREGIEDSGEGGVELGGEEGEEVGGFLIEEV